MGLYYRLDSLELKNNTMSFKVEVTGHNFHISEVFFINDTFFHFNLFYFWHFTHTFSTRLSCETYVIFLNFTEKLK